MISLFASANRPEFWMILYERWASNKTPFEVIFVGNVRPEFKLPRNFKFIYSEVKPAQCYHIASKEAQGDCLVHVADDFWFSLGSLDKMLEMFEQHDSLKTIVSHQYRNKGIFRHNRTD